ncbi:helicase associated domain-containing protein, partial [Embleya sp. NPDC055664]
VRAGLRPGQVRQLDALGITAETEHGHGAVAGGGGTARGRGGAAEGDMGPDGTADGDGVEDGVAVAAGVGGAEGGGGRVAGAGRGVAVAGGVGGAEGGVGGGVAPRRGRGAWETAFTAAVAYRGRAGHLEVPRGHVETVAMRTTAGPDGGDEGGGAVEVRLGKWVNNQRTRRSSLSEERVRLLTELGMRW